MSNVQAVLTYCEPQLLPVLCPPPHQHVDDASDQTTQIETAVGDGVCHDDGGGSRGDDQYHGGGDQCHGDDDQCDDGGELCDVPDAWRRPLFDLPDAA